MHLPADYPRLLVYNALKAFNHYRRFRKQISTAKSQPDSKLSNTTLQFVPFRLGGSHGLRFS